MKSSLVLREYRLEKFTHLAMHNLLQQSSKFSSSFLFWQPKKESKTNTSPLNTLVRESISRNFLRISSDWKLFIALPSTVQYFEFLSHI